WVAVARAAGRCAVLLSDTSRGGRTTVSEAVSTRNRQSAVNEQPSSAQAYTLMAPPCQTTSTAAPSGSAAPNRSTGAPPPQPPASSGSPPGGGQSCGASSQAR